MEVFLYTCGRDGEKGWREIYIFIFYVEKLVDNG